MNAIANLQIGSIIIFVIGMIIHFTNMIKRIDSKNLQIVAISMVIISFVVGVITLILLYQDNSTAFFLWLFYLLMLLINVYNCLNYYDRIK